MRVRVICLLAVALALPPGTFADFQYTETTKITGGSIMSMAKLAGAFSKQSRQITAPVVHSVYVKGNRMARIDPDYSEIIDLDKETVTHIDHQKKQYYVITFQQMREQLLEAQRQAAQQPAPKPQTEQPKSDPANTPKLNFDVAVRNTGVQREFSGIQTSESILALTVQATDQPSGQTGNLAMTNDLWLTPEIPGYQEVRDFYARYAQKLGDVYGSVVSSAVKSMQAHSQMSNPGSSQGFGEMAKQMSKLKGVPIYTVMRMGTTLDGKPLPAASEAPLPDADLNANLPSKTDVAEQGAGNATNSAIASKLGGLGAMMGGFGRKKQNPQPPAAASDTSSQPQPTSMVLMETTTEISGFSHESIDGARFSPPAGYQQVQVPDRHLQ